MTEIEGWKAECHRSLAMRAQYLGLPAMWIIGIVGLWVAVFYLAILWAPLTTPGPVIGFFVSYGLARRLRSYDDLIVEKLWRASRIPPHLEG